VTRLIKSCDIYHKITTEYDTKSSSSNLINLITIVLIFMLCLSEFSTYWNPEFISDLQVDLSTESESKITINIDIDLPKVPCHIISVDVEDVIGSHIVDFEGDLKKRIMDKNGRILEILDAKERTHNSKEVLEKTKEGIEKNMGCNLKGSIIVNKINGNFHISSHAYTEAVMTLYSNQKMLDFTHKINHLSFGAEDHIAKITKLTGGYNLSPLDKIGESIHPQNLGNHFHNTHTTYYLDIMATKYYIGTEEQYSAHEYTYSFQTVTTHGMPAIFVKFELSPLFINYKVSQNLFFVFFIRC